MDKLQAAIANWELYLSIFLLLLTLVVRMTCNTKGNWAWIGCLMLITAAGNAAMLVPFGDAASAHLKIWNILGTTVFGALGATFVANWLTDGAT